jgi:DNA modification methylase
VIIRADARAIPLADNSVQCVVTSPPYWGLRDYGTARWKGGDVDCDHKNLASAPMGTMDGHSPDQPARQGMTKPYRDTCGKCGAHRIDAQIGLERTPEEYIATIVAVFREVHRVLKKDGTLWLNLGDSYANDGKWGGETGGKQAYLPDNDRRRCGREKRLTGLKPKDLCGMPWRIALALQADGWWLRSDIIWAKPNPMPESVRDRPTRAHEYLFLLTKSARYFYDAKAIMEPASPATHARIAQPRIFSQAGGAKDYGEGSNRSMRKALTNLAHRARGVSPKTALGTVGVVRANPSFASAIVDLVLERNKRDVWTISTQPCPEAHFATFPEKLVEPCILAGSRPGDVVFDPFLGSGTVGVVAQRLGRRWAGMELSTGYIAIARARISQPPKPTRTRRRAPHLISPKPNWLQRDAARPAERSRSSHKHG